MVSLHKVGHQMHEDAPDWIEKLVRNKKVFVFDWDGTILDSMERKMKNFGQAFCSSIRSESDARMESRVCSYYQRLSGHPRKHIYLQIMAKLEMEAEPDSFERFNLAFEELNECSLINARIFPDALVMLNELVIRGRPIFISSSVPPEELKNMVKSTLPDSVKMGITAVLGSRQGHSKGRQHLKEIMKQANAAKDEIIVFGDNIADHELSSEAGVDCILVNRSGNSDYKDINIVASLTQVMDGLPK